MKIKNILVSQPTPAIAEKSPFYEIISKHRTNVDFRPFIKVEGVSLKEFRSQRIEILEHSAIVFTSRTTVDNFFRICEEARISIPEGMKYLCNTEAVALYLQKYIVYRKRKIFFANGNFTNFMELIVKHKEEKMLLTLSEPHKEEIPLTMEKLKLNFNKVILARTVSSDLSDVDITKYDLLVFYSPTEITSLLSNFGSENLPRIATFGDGTTRAAITAGLTINVIAPTPQVPSMTKAIDIYMAAIHSGTEVAPVIIEDNTQADEFVKAQEAKPVKKSRTKKSAADKTASAKKSTKTTASKASASKTTKSKTATTGKTVAAKSSSTKTTPKATEKSAIK